MNEAQAAEQIMRESVDRPDPEVLGKYCRVTEAQERNYEIVTNIEDDDRFDIMPSVRDELSKLRSELSACLEINKNANAAIGDIANECKRYAAENAELRKDKARLDWFNSGNWKAERFNATVWLTRTEKGYDLNLYPTIRDAIDAQMTK